MVAEDRDFKSPLFFVTCAMGVYVVSETLLDHQAGEHCIMYSTAYVSHVPFPLHGRSSAYVSCPKRHEGQGANGGPRPCRAWDC